MVTSPIKEAKVSVVLIALLACLLICSLLVIATGAEVFNWGARISFLLLCLAGRRFFTFRETSLLILALVTTGIALKLTQSASVILSALDLAAFFGAFIAALTAMRDVAARSRSILAVGRYLTGQPPGRRYYSTAIGGHLLGVFLNFGAVSLMSPLVQQSAKNAMGKPDEALERRQLSALIRGFAWVLLWAPTTLSQAVLLTIFTEVTWADIAPLGLSTAVFFIVLGRLYDRLEWRRLPVSTPADAPHVPWHAVFLVSLICVVLIGTTLLVSSILSWSIAQTLMFVAPAVTFFWFLGQTPPASISEVLHRSKALVDVLSPSATVLARSAVALGLSGYIGRTLGRTLPVDQFASMVDLSALPGWLFLAMLPVIITLGGQLALSPILLVVLLGEFLSAAGPLPTGQMQILFALSVGWSLSMTASPNATATLLISSTTGIPPTTLTWRWNLRYGMLCYACSIAIFALIA